MKKLIYILLAILFAGCNNAEKQKEEAERKLYAQLLDSLKNSIDTLTWHEEYTFQGKGNKSVDSVNVNGPIRLTYVFQGRANSSFTVNREENGELTAPLLVLTSSKSKSIVKKDSLKSATLKIISNSGRWALSFSSLRYKSPLHCDSISPKLYSKLSEVQDSLLDIRINSLDSIQPASTAILSKSLLEWNYLANSSYIWNANPIFNLNATTIRLQIELDIPEEKYYWDFMNKKGYDGLLIELKNVRTGKSKVLFRYKGKCGYHTFTKEESIPAGSYQIEYSGIGDISFNIYNLQ